MALFLLERAWTGERIERRLLLEEDGGRIAGLTALGDAPLPPGAEVVFGLTLPGLANCHSHCFHRALRGRTESPGGGDDFWGWRERMYQVAAALEPDSYFELARAVYTEMALAGVTEVGEFHYLHHRREGEPYPDGEMERALSEAAREVGIRLTLLDTCYLRPGFDGGPMSGAAIRFADRDALSWRARVDRVDEGPLVRVGAAIHSVRGVDPQSMVVVSAWARERGAPLHLHLSEQIEENRQCLEATGMTPTALVAAAGVLSERTTAVHAVHLTGGDVQLLADSGTTVCACPTTERDLADGVCPGEQLAAADVPICLGSDSHAVVDLFEEARALELDQRLLSHRRGHHLPEELLHFATIDGAGSLGWDAGALEVGRLADFCALELESPRMAGAPDLDLPARAVFAGNSADIHSVVVGGRWVVRGGEHVRHGRGGALLTKILSDLEAKL